MHHVLQPESLGHAAPTGVPKSARQLTVLQDSEHRIGEADRVSRWDEQTGHSVLDGLGNPADPGRHHRHAGGHRFEHDVREAFAERRKHGHGDRGEQFRYVQSEPCERHTPLEAETADVIL